MPSAHRIALPGPASMNDVADQVRMERRRAGTGPVVLQVLPALGEGGAERGTVDLARYLIGHGWQALVASSGGARAERASRRSAPVPRLPLHSKNPFTIRANIRRLQRLIREHRVQLVHARSRAPAWSAWYAARRCRRALRHHLPRRLSRQRGPVQAALQRDHGARRAGDRDLGVRRRPRPHPLSGAAGAAARDPARGRHHGRSIPRRCRRSGAPRSPSAGTSSPAPRS